MLRRCWEQASIRPAAWGLRTATRVSSHHFPLLGICATQPWGRSLMALSQNASLLPHLLSSLGCPMAAETLRRAQGPGASGCVHIHAGQWKWLCRQQERKSWI